MLRAVANTSLADKVFEQLTAEIVNGHYVPGATIPSERTLSVVFAVNRHVVREAVKRLEQVGLVKVVQGGGTKVLDFRHTAGLDLLAVVAEHADAVEALLPLLVAALEMRAGIGVDLVRLCAQRSAALVGEDLVELAEQLSAVAAGRRSAAARPALLAADPRRGGQPRLSACLQQPDPRRPRGSPHLSLPWLEHELERSDFRRPIAAAIAAGDAEAAADRDARRADAIAGGLRLTRPDPERRPPE